MSRYVVTTTELSVHELKESPLYGEGVIKVRLEDEGGGIFLVIDGSFGDPEPEPGVLRIDVEQFDRLVEAVEVLTGPMDLDSGKIRGEEP